MWLCDLGGTPIVLSATASFQNSGTAEIASDDWYTGEGRVIIPQVGGVRVSEDYEVSDLATAMNSWSLASLSDSNGNAATIYSTKFSQYGGIWLACGTSMDGDDPTGLVFKSNDHGATWRRILEVPNADLRALAGDANTAKWFVGGSNHTLYRTTNDGLSWHLLDGFDLAGQPGAIISIEVSDVLENYPLEGEGQYQILG